MQREDAKLTVRSPLRPFFTNGTDIETHSLVGQTSTMEFFAKLVNGYQ